MNSTEKKFKAYTLKNFRNIEQLKSFSDEKLFDIEVVGNILPFRINQYVLDELIDWDNIPNDPIYQLTFPQKSMLSETHFGQMAEVLKSTSDKKVIKHLADKIRWQLNPHPAGQQHNVPEVNGTKLTGMQHKYRETVLFFPSQAQTCHAYCTFCFRWPQFVGIDELKFAMQESNLLVEYVRQNPQITDVLFTGGDPMVMGVKNFSAYVNALLDAKLPNLKTIRIGTKVLSYWPYKFLTDPGADDMLKLFKKITDSGIHLAFMAHINHHAELKTQALELAVERILETGATIRTQAPVMKHINDSADVWSTMWRRQVDLGMIPYYMFLARDTGAQDYFSVPLAKAWHIFRDAYNNVSGICRTVRGPSMSANPGKVQVVGITELQGKKVFCLRFLQGRNPDWVYKLFFAEYDEKAVWIDDLKPAFGDDKFFFETDAPIITNDKKIPVMPVEDLAIEVV